METLVVNFFAGPGTGKSSMMASVFAALKWDGVNCEMAHEYAKEKVWEESLAILDDQVYVFAKQNHKIKRLIGKVDIIITDSPLLLSLIYGKNERDSFKEFVSDTHDSYNNLNFFLTRCKAYNPKGRVQNEVKAKALDVTICKMLEDYEEVVNYVDAAPENLVDIVVKIREALKELKETPIVDEI